MQVKPSRAASLIEKYLLAKVVPMLRGSPGIGKSDLVRAIAAKYNLLVIDVRLTQCDPTDLNGFPSLSGAKATYLPMDTFPIQGDEIPKGYNGWLIFLDELSSANEAVQAAAYKLTLDRMVGRHKLHDKVAVVAAGNLESDGAIVNPMSTALQSRLAHIEMAVDVEDWLDWALRNDIHHHITDFIKFKPGMLYTFKPDHSDNTYASPRTWEFANRLIGFSHESEFTALLAGVITEGVAREFINYCKVYKTLPKLEDILATPEKVLVPDEPGVLFALAGSVAEWATKDNLGNLLKYVNRIPKEFQVRTLRECVRRKRELLSHPEMTNWIHASRTELF
jgi:hypothetical protein